MRIVLQAFGLQFHRAPVLLDEFREHEFQQLGAERHPAKEVPGGDDIDAAVVARNRSNCGQAREPVFPRSDGFRAQVGQGKVDGGGHRVGIGVQAQQFVRRGVRTGGVSAHAEAVGDGLEIFLLLVDARPLAPPPGLMDKGSVGRVHQANNAVVDTYRHVGGEVGELAFFAELLDLGRSRWGLDLLGKAGACRRRFGDVDPDELIVLFAGVASGINAIDFQSLTCGQGGNELALTSVGVEPPAVVSALDLLSIELPAMQGHAAVWAGVTQGEGLSLMVATEYQRDFEQHGFLKLVAMNAVGWHSAIPEAGEHERIGHLALGGFEFRHELK